MTEDFGRQAIAISNAVNSALTLEELTTAVAAYIELHYPEYGIPYYFFVRITNGPCRRLSISSWVLQNNLSTVHGYELIPINNNGRRTLIRRARYDEVAAEVRKRNPSMNPSQQFQELQGTINLFQEMRYSLRRETARKPSARRSF